MLIEDCSGGSCSYGALQDFGSLERNTPQLRLVKLLEQALEWQGLWIGSPQAVSTGVAMTRNQMRFLLPKLLHGSPLGGSGLDLQALKRSVMRSLEESTCCHDRSLVL